MTNHLGTIGDSNTLDGAYTGLDPDQAAAAERFIRAHDDAPDDLLWAVLGIEPGVA